MTAGYTRSNYFADYFQDPAKPFTRHNWLVTLEYWNNCCAVCGRPPDNDRKIVADHWWPRSRGGLTALDNIVPLCHGKGGCNNSKGSQRPDRWLIEQAGPDAVVQKMEEIAQYFGYMVSRGTIPVVKKRRPRKLERATEYVTIGRNTRNRLREFSHGLGATYDETIDLLLRLAMNPGEDEMLAGRRLRDKLDDEADEPPTMTLPQPALAAVSVAAQPDMRLTRPWPKSRSVGGKA